MRRPAEERSLAGANIPGALSSVALLQRQSTGGELPLCHVDNVLTPLSVHKFGKKIGAGVPASSIIIIRQWVSHSQPWMLDMDRLRAVSPSDIFMRALGFVFSVSYSRGAFAVPTEELHGLHGVERVAGYACRHGGAIRQHAGRF